MEIRCISSAAAFGLLLLGCESLPGPSPLSETPWEVVTLGGKAPIPTPKPLQAEFLPNGTIIGFGGINRFERRYQLRGKRISPAEEVSSTLVGTIIPALADQEGAFIHAIGQTRSYFISDGDLLHLCAADGKDLTTLKRVPR